MQTNSSSHFNPTLSPSLLIQGVDCHSFGSSSSMSPAPAGGILSYRGSRYDAVQVWWYRYINFLVGSVWALRLDSQRFLLHHHYFALSSAVSISPSESTLAAEIGCSWSRVVHVCARSRLSLAGTMLVSHRPPIVWDSLQQMCLPGS